MERGRRRRRAILGAAQDEPELAAVPEDGQQDVSETEPAADPWGPSEPFVEEAQAADQSSKTTGPKSIQRWLGLSSLKNTDDLQFAEVQETTLSDTELSRDEWEAYQQQLIQQEATASAVDPLEAAGDEPEFEEEDTLNSIPEGPLTASEDGRPAEGFRVRVINRLSRRRDDSLNELSEEESDVQTGDDTVLGAGSEGSDSSGSEEPVSVRESFVTDDDDMIKGEPAPEMIVYPALPEGLLDSATHHEDDSADIRQSEDSWDTPQSSLSQSAETDHSNTGAAMKEPSEHSARHELAASRMERLKPKSANSLTGAPSQKLDVRVEDSVLAPETEVLLVAVHAPERNTFRTYLRRHDIPCRAAISADNAVNVVLEMKPAAVLLSGSGMNPEEIITLVDDINDMVDAPILALLTESQIKLLSNDPLSAHVLQYPASLRHIRSELNRILVEEGNAKPRCSLRSALLPE
ncbi:MAG: hypothetical protein R3C49_07070 [Planctomycetaceae bacterium]